jgi:hypothetical protein
MDMPQRNAMGNADSPKWPMTQLWQGKKQICFMMFYVYNNYRTIG